MSARELSVGTNIFYPTTLTLEFGLIFENFNRVNNLLTVSTSALIFHMRISGDKIFLPVSGYLSLAIFGIGHYLGHLCFTNISWYEIERQ